MYTIFSIVMIVGFTLCYIPQIVRTYRTKSVCDLNIWMWWIAGVAYLAAIGTMLYTFLWAQFVTYVLGLGCTILEIVLYYKYLKRNKPVTPIRIFNINKSGIPSNMHIL